MDTKTSTALLKQLADPDGQQVWAEFNDRYRPILLGFARRLGLPEQDAEDAAQESLTRFVRRYREGAYDRGKGRLRSWLLAIAENCIRELHRDGRRRKDWRGQSAMGKLDDDGEFEELWAAEWREAVTAAALRELRRSTDTDPKTVEAFERVVLQGRPAAEVGQEPGMTRNAVYVAKHRAIERLRPIMERLEREF